MAITSGFFNSVNGDRLYNAEEMTNYFEGIVSNGVYESVGDAMIVLATGNGLEITVGTGRAIALMHWVKNDAVLPLMLSPANVRYDRIDAVVVRVDKTARTGTIEIIEGTAAAEPIAPTRKNTETVCELVLATIRVRKGASTITQSDVMDARPSILCGWVTGVVQQVDTSKLFLQWQTAYEEYYQKMTADFEQYVAEKYLYFALRQKEFDQWFAETTASLRVKTKLQKYQYVYSADVPVRSINVGIAEYESIDVLLVFVDGVFFTIGVDVLIDGVGASALAIFANQINAGSTVTFVVLKSVIDPTIENVSNATVATESAGTSIVAFAESDELEG